MKRFICLFIVLISLVSTNIMAKDIMILKLAYGDVEIELYPDKAPNHVKDLRNLLIVENMMELCSIELLRVLWPKLGM